MGTRSIVESNGNAGTGNVVVTDPSLRYMRPYDAGVRDGDEVTLLEEGDSFELAEAMHAIARRKARVYARRCDTLDRRRISNQVKPR
jgi:hypothetical protein